LVSVMAQQQQQVDGHRDRSQIEMPPEDQGGGVADMIQNMVHSAQEAPAQRHGAPTIPAV